MATILIVEDERDLSSLIRRHLEAEGHQVLQAYDGPSAVQFGVVFLPPFMVISMPIDPLVFYSKVN